MYKRKNILKIAIDSPAAAGAGTLGKALSKHYNLYYLDTGKIYRYIAYLKLKTPKKFNQKFIKSKIKTLKTKYKLRKIFFPLLILLFPLIGKIFFKLDWNGFDFLVMVLLILSFSILINLTLYYLRFSKFKFLLVFILMIIFMLIWIELAVGIFGTAFAGS